MLTCGQCHLVYPKCQRGAFSEAKLFRVMNTNKADSVKEYFCDPLCYIKNRRICRMSWKEVERFYHSRAALEHQEDDSLSPDADDETLYQAAREYKRLYRLDPSLTLEELRAEQAQLEIIS